MKLVNTKWKGDESKRIRLKGEGYSAVLHFIPDEELKVPEGALKKLGDDIQCKRLIVLDTPSDIEDVKEDTEKNMFGKPKRSRKKESSITDSIAEEV